MTVRLFPAAITMCAVLQSTLLPLKAQEPITKLNVVVVEGSGAVNNIRSRTAREAIVQVEDQNRKPVAGALVTFALPEQGPGVVVSNGAKLVKVVSGPDGRAILKGLHASKTPGTFNIQVTASAQGSAPGNVVTASTTVSQTNLVGPAMLFGSVPLTATTLAIGAAVVTAGVVTGFQLSDSSRTVISYGAPRLP